MYRVITYRLYVPHDDRQTICSLCSPLLVTSRCKVARGAQKCPHNVILLLSLIMLILCVCVCECLSVCLCVHAYVCMLSTCQHKCFVCVCVRGWVCACVSVCVFACPCAYGSFHVCTRVYVCLCVMVRHCFLSTHALQS